LIDLDTGDWQAIPTNLTLHRTFRISAKDKLPTLDESELNRGVNYRVIVSGTREEIAAFKESPGYKAKIMYEFKNSEAARLDINASDDQTKMMSKFVEFEIKRLYGSKEQADIDSDKLMKLGKSLLARATGGK
jgi:hypothetical protein